MTDNENAQNKSVHDLYTTADNGATLSLRQKCGFYGAGACVGECVVFGDAYDNDTTIRQIVSEDGVGRCELVKAYEADELPEPIG